MEKINVTIALNVLNAKKEKIFLAYVSNINREKQVILLMIPNGEGREAKSEGWWHSLPVKQILTLLRGITSKHYSDFYCLNPLHFFRTKNKLELHKKSVWK